jgi:hypothetical protein
MEDFDVVQRTAAVSAALHASRQCAPSNCSCEKDALGAIEMLLEPMDDLYLYDPQDGEVHANGLPLTVPVTLTT